MIKNVVFVTGPTACGKTALGVRLAKIFSGEIISADSMQIYKGIHIASAAPDEEEKQGVPHHLLEFAGLDSRYSVADYVKDARRVIDEVYGRGRLPIVVGGTGLYISSLADNTVFPDEETDLGLRCRLEEKFDRLGAEKMLEELRKFDPESAARLHPGDRRRIIRCFEIYETTGETMTRQNIRSHEGPGEIKPIMIGITYRNREILYNRINLRVDRMIASGLLEEARRTMCGSDGKGAFQAIGHKELYGFLKGECSLEQAVELLKQQTRRYAKRQMTWFRRDSRINWIYADECEDMVKTAAEIVRNNL